MEEEQLEGTLQAVDQQQEATSDSEHDQLAQALQQRDTALEYGLAAEAELQEVEQKLRGAEAAMRTLHQELANVERSAGRDLSLL